MFDDNPTIIKAIAKTEYVLNHYSEVMVSISGGADSDCMLALIDLLKHDLTPKIHYVFFDTGLEYQATKEHISYLVDRYKIPLEIYKAHTPIPSAIKQYGLPFLSKRHSEYIERLQRYNFDWSVDNFLTLYEKYPKCKAALRWWTNSFGENSRFNINHSKLLREYMLLHPPTFNISPKCCDCAKKKTSKEVVKKHDIELSIVGLRKYEGGARSVINNCWNKNKGSFYPLLWFTDSDKCEFETALNIKHSRCYTEYGLHRTGCAGCPFGQHYNDELEIIKRFEPKLYNACMNIFGQSYKYTNDYKKFMSTGGQY